MHHRAGDLLQLVVEFEELSAERGKILTFTVGQSESGEDRSQVGGVIGDEQGSVHQVNGWWSRFW